MSNDRPKPNMTERQYQFLMSRMREAYDTASYYRNQPNLPDPPAVIRAKATIKKHEQAKETLHNQRRAKLKKMFEGAQAAILFQPGDEALKTLEKFIAEIAKL